MFFLRSAGDISKALLLVLRLAFTDELNHHPMRLLHTRMPGLNSATAYNTSDILQLHT
jgi:hypothetical protein